MTGSQSGGHVGRACAKVLWQERAGLFKANETASVWPKDR